MTSWLAVLDRAGQSRLITITYTLRQGWWQCRRWRHSIFVTARKRKKMTVHKQNRHMVAWLFGFDASNLRIANCRLQAKADAIHCAVSYHQGFALRVET